MGCTPYFAILSSLEIYWQDSLTAPPRRGCNLSATPHLRELFSETQVFRASIPWTFKMDASRLLSGGLLACALAAQAAAHVTLRYPQPVLMNGTLYSL